MTSITSEEINYLIYRYLQEAGFVHSAFSFGQESFISKADIKSSAVPPGMLITLLQRGLHYTSIEFHLNDDGSEKDCAKSYSLLEPHVCEKATAMPPPPPSLRPTTPSSQRPRSTSTNPITTASSTSIQIKDNITKTIMTMGKKENGVKKRKKGAADTETDSYDPYDMNNDAKGLKSRSKKIGLSGGKSKQQTGRVFSKVNILTGHESEVITCAWNPSKDINLLASASGDGTSRLWTVPGEGGPWDVDEAKLTVKILDHLTATNDSKPVDGSGSRDVTALNWSPDGQILATGCYDGKARLWTIHGELIAVLSQHKGPIFQLQWSPNGKLLVSAGLEPSVVVWNIEQRSLLRSYSHHTAPALDVDWRDDETFATCATDRLIHVYIVHQDDPILVLTGHTDEVNSIKWSPSGTLLLSSSDDMSAKIWKISSDARIGELQATLSEHTQEIYTAKWNGDDMVATASFDSTVKLWDINGPKCLQTLRRHNQPVYAIAFSPCGRYIASGSLDATLIIWSIIDEKVLKTYQSKGGIFEVTWSKSGDRVAACTSEKELIVLDVNHSPSADYVVNNMNV